MRCVLCTGKYSEGTVGNVHRSRVHPVHAYQFFFFTFHHRYSKTQCWQSCATLTYDGSLLSDSLPHQPSLENN